MGVSGEESDPASARSSLGQLFRHPRACPEDLQSQPPAWRHL